MTACTCAQQRAFVGLFSQNKAEWVIAEQGCSAYSLVSVPLYDTLGTSAVVRTGMLRCISWDCVGCVGPDAASYIINQTEMTTIVVGEDKLSIVR